jgi:hypothetical protein
VSRRCGGVHHECGDVGAAVGLRINHDGGVFTVVELAGRRLLLRRHGDGELRQVEIGWLLSQAASSMAG